LNALADRIEDVYKGLVGLAEEGFILRDGEPAFGPAGQPANEIIMDMLQAEYDSIGTRLTGILSRRNPIDYRDDPFDLFDDSSNIYAIQEPTGEDLHHTWNEFCEQLKNHRRFFMTDSKELLDRLLGPILRGEWPPNGVVRTVGPETDVTHVYRGRKANDEGQRQTILASRLRQLNAPEPGRAGAGRMNAPGIGLFYGALDQETCVAELRVPVGGGAIVGRFEILRPLRVLDLTLLDEAYEELSYFADNYIERRSYGGFMRSFHQQVRRVVVPGRETLDYLPTQLVAEYLWSQADPRVDGVIFESAQISAGHKNLVLFPHASILEGADAEVERTVEFVSYRRPEEDHEVDPEDRVYFRPLPAPPLQVPPPMVGNDADFFAAALEQIALRDEQQPTIRLGNEDVFRVIVNGIVYDQEAVPVRFAEWHDPGF